MIFLLGGSGYIGNAYIEYFERSGIAFRSPESLGLRLHESC